MKCTNPVPDPKQTHGHTWGTDYYQCSYCKLEFDEYINQRDAQLPRGPGKTKHIASGAALYLHWQQSQNMAPSGIPVEIKCECGVDSIQGSFEPHSSWCPRGGTK